MNASLGWGRFAKQQSHWALAVMFGLAVLGAAITAQAQAPKVRIGVQAVPPDEAFVARNWLEPYGIKGEITQFSSGGDMLQAFIAGRIDIANGGSARLVTLAAKQPEIFYIIAAHQYGGDRYGVMVAKNSAISNIAQLKGKKIGAVKGSGTYETFCVYLEKNGLSERDFQVINLKVEDIRASLQQGLVEAGVAWEPFVAIAETMGVARRIISMKGINESPNFILVSRSFAEQNPDTVTKFLAALIEMADFIKNKPAEAGKLTADGISKRGVTVDPKALALAFTRLHVSGEVTDQLIAELIPIAQSMRATNKIKEIPNFEKLVNRIFYQNALKMAKSRG